MKTFIKDCILFLAVILFIILLGLVLPNRCHPRSIDYSLLAKHKHLAEINKPKLILTGGSNVLFGFDSKILSDSLKKPVVNHAIHAGYGLKYILDDVLPYINKGDTLILSPEYSHFIGNNYLGKEPLLFSLTAVPQNLKLISINQFINVASFIPKFSFGRMKSLVYSLLDPQSTSSNTGVYSEHAINSYGDNHTHWGLKKTDFESYKFTGHINPQTFTYLDQIKQSVEARGAKLFISYPSLCLSTYNINKETINSIKAKLEQSQFHILGVPQLFVYPDSLFYDTPYHLGKQGAGLRTATLLNLLKK